MRYPVRVKFRKSEVKIYGKRKSYPFYRVAGKVAGKRKMESFTTYSKAKDRADALVREIDKGSTVSALTAKQAADALAALERLESFHRSTGKRLSLVACVTEYCAETSKLNGHTLPTAVDGFLGTVATVKRKDVSQGVEEFLAAEKPRTEERGGSRPELSPKYHYNRTIILRRFAATFPNTAICDLTREHMDKFMGGPLVAKFSPKSRNHQRGAIRQFLQWAVSKDFLSGTHRLFESSGLKQQTANTVETEFYLPKEFRALLLAAEGPMQAIIAIGGLAGLRTVELLRLDWEDVWRVDGHIEVTSSKSKTRQRRLVEICPSLGAWLQPFRTFKTGMLWERQEGVYQKKFKALCETIGVDRKVNGLRHSFCSFHFALHGNENLTAAQAGNSPAMIHAHYKGFATKAEAQTWFLVRP